MPINQFGIVRAGRFSPFLQPFFVQGDCHPMLSRIPPRKAFRMKLLRHLKGYLPHFQIIAPKTGQEESADIQIRPVRCLDSASFGSARRCSRIDPRYRFWPREVDTAGKAVFLAKSFNPTPAQKTQTSANHAAARRSTRASVVLCLASHRQHLESL
jgi:hypothetical protein